MQGLAKMNNKILPGALMRIDFVTIIFGKLHRKCNTCSLAGALFLSVLSGATLSATDDTSQVADRITFSAGSDKSYSFTDIKVEDQDSVLLISGRVKSAGKQLRGHIDIAVLDSSGTLLRKVSVKPYFNNRPGIGTKYTIGFPFKAKIHFEETVTAHKFTLRLALHRDSERRYTVYDCGANEAVQSYKR
jgi:hypothetical protein